MGKVALLQMVSSTRVIDNLARAEQLLQQAHDAGAILAVLPENFALMAVNREDKFHNAELEGHGIIQTTISRLAKQLNLWIVAGSIATKGKNDKLRSTCFVYDEKGLTVARYDKIHLFDVSVSNEEIHQESSIFDAGKDLVVVDTPVGKLGLTICYDLRFPELYYQLLQKGAEIFTVVSAFTKITGSAHWEVLLRARAIENLAYILASNQGGKHENGRTTFGHSMVIDPWGIILADKPTGTGIVIAEIDLLRLHQLRQQFPTIDHHVLHKISTDSIGMKVH